MWLLCVPYFSYKSYKSIPQHLNKYISIDFLQTLFHFYKMINDVLIQGYAATFSWNIFFLITEVT